MERLGGGEFGEMQRTLVSQTAPCSHNLLQHATSHHIAWKFQVGSTERLVDGSCAVSADGQLTGRETRRTHADCLCRTPSSPRQIAPTLAVGRSFSA